MSNQVDASQSGFNLDVFTTEMIDTMTSSLGNSLLQFPDLTSGILSGITPYSVMLSMAFGLFILGYFIMLKTFPDNVTKLGNVPGLDGLNMLKGKDWKTFLIQFLIVTFFVFIFLGKGISGYNMEGNMGLGVKNVFVGNPKQGSSILAGEKATSPYVDIIINPLEGIRFTGYKYDDGGKIIDVATTQSSNSSVKSGAKCNYEKESYEAFANGNSGNAKDCVYPADKQAMLIVDSFSTQLNTEKSKPVPVYITNNFDYVDKEKKGKKEEIEMKKSSEEQNKHHSIVSVLLNQNSRLENKGTDAQVTTGLLEFLKTSNDFLAKLVAKENGEEDGKGNIDKLPLAELQQVHNSLKENRRLFDDVRRYANRNKNDKSDEVKATLKQKIEAFLNHSVNYIAYESDTAVDIITAKYKNNLKNPSLKTAGISAFDSFIKESFKGKTTKDIIVGSGISGYTYDLKREHLNPNASISTRDLYGKEVVDRILKYAEDGEYDGVSNFLTYASNDVDKAAANIISNYTSVYIGNFNEKYANAFGAGFKVVEQAMGTLASASGETLDNYRKECLGYVDHDGLLKQAGNLIWNAGAFLGSALHLNGGTFYSPAEKKHIPCSFWSNGGAALSNVSASLVVGPVALMGEIGFGALGTVADLDFMEDKAAVLSNEEIKAVTEKLAQISTLIVNCNKNYASCGDEPSSVLDKGLLLTPAIQILEDEVSKRVFIENFSDYVVGSLEGQDERLNKTISYFDGFGFTIKNDKFASSLRKLFGDNEANSLIEELTNEKILSEAKDNLKYFAQKKALEQAKEAIAKGEEVSVGLGGATFTQFSPNFFKQFGEKQFENYAGSLYLDANNVFGNDKQPYYNGFSKVGDTDGNAHGVWNQKLKEEQAKESLVSKTIKTFIGMDNDITYVGVNSNGKHKNGIELRTGDIVFASPGTTIYALPYPIKLRMNAEMAETIEFLDRKGGVIATYGNRYNADGTLRTKGTPNTVGEIYSGGVYYTIASIFGEKSVNWTFNPLYGFGVSEMAGGNLIIITFVNIFITPGKWIYDLFSLFFYIVAFLFPVFGLWLLIVDGKLNKIGKYLLALFLALASTPLWGYLIIGLYWLTFSGDDAGQYALRNFTLGTSSLMLIVLAYVPIILTIFFYKFLIDWLIKGKVNIGTMVGSGVIYGQGSAGGALMNKIKGRGSGKGKDGDKNNSGDGTNNDSSSSRDKKSYNNDYTGRGVGNTVQNSAFEVNNDDILKQFETKGGPGEYVTQDVNGNDIFRRIDFENKYKATDEETEALRQSQIQDGKFLAMKDDGDIDELAEMNKIGRVNSRELLTLFEIYKQGMENGMSKGEFARSMNVIYKDHQEKFRKLLETLEEVEKAKGKNPEFNKKLERAKNTLTERDVKFIKELEKKNGGILNRENLKREFSLLTNSLKDGSGLNFETLNKTQAITSYMNLLEKSKEEQFEMMSKALENTLGNSMKNNSRGAELQRRIASMVANGDFNGLKDLENLNKDVDGLADYIRKVQTVPSEMMKVLHAQLDAKQLSSSADGINKFLGMMKNNAEIEKLKFEDVNRYLAVTKEINEFRQADMQKKISMATKAAIGSSDAQMKAIKNSEQITKKLTEEILFTMENQGMVTNQSLNSMVEAFDITARDKKIIKDRLKDKLNTIKELNG